jgi:hypothetical protein
MRPDFFQLSPYLGRTVTLDNEMVSYFLEATANVPVVD